MPLSFLVPAFLAGLAALAIPLLVHLTRRPRSRAQDFPSLMFLERIPIRTEERRRIHHWLLLSLRALAVLLLVAAFARPFLTSEALATASGRGPTERVVLLDRSWSMAAPGRWERAVEAARQALASPGPLDRASLVVFDQGGEAVVRSSAEPARLSQALDTLEPGARATRFGPGLKLAQTILEESDLPAGEVTLISDFPAGGWTGDEGVLFPEGTQVAAVDVALDQPPVENRAVAQVTLERERAQDRDRVVPTARLTRTGGADEAPALLTLEVDGREVQTARVTLPPSGSAGFSFQPVTLSQRHTRLTVRLEADDLPQDDAYHLVLSPGRATRVHLASPPSRGTRGDLYLRRALEVDDEGRFEVVAGGVSTPGADRLGEGDVLILSDVPYPGGAGGRDVRAWVESGGGLIVVSGDRGGWPEPFADLFPGTLGGVTDRDGRRGERLASLDYDHPVFEPFRGPRQGDFASARFYRARDFRASGDDGVRILARFDDGSVALAERTVGEGRVLVWTSTLDAFWTDLALKPVFLPLVHSLVGYASGRNEPVEAFTAGQVLDVTDAQAMESAGLGQVAEALAAAEDRVALTPRGETRDLSAGDHFLELARPGHYLIRPPGRDDVRPVAVAVNVDRAEVEPARVDPERVVAAVGGTVGQGPADPTPAGPGALQLQRVDQERRQSLWRYLLLGALGLLAVETVLSNRLGRTRRHGGGHAQLTV